MNIYCVDVGMGYSPPGAVGSGERAALAGRSMDLALLRKAEFTVPYTASFTGCPVAPFKGAPEESRETNVEFCSTQGEKNGR